MKMKIIALALIVFASLMVKAQTVDNTVNKVNNTLNEADKVQSTFNSIKGFLPKKKTKNHPVDTTASVPAAQAANNSGGSMASAHLTIVKITGIDYATLKKLNSNIQACEGVQEAKMKFGADSSSIEIKHSGTTDNLLSVIELTSKDIFTDTNIVGAEEGSVSIKLK